VLPRDTDALAMFRDGLVIAREQGDERLVTALLLNLANKQDGVGKVADAVATYHEVITRAKAQQDDQNLATAQMNLGDSLQKLGQSRAVIPLVSEALASFQRRGDQNGICWALGSRGDLRWGTGDLKGARDDFEAALAERVRIGEERNIATSRDKLARLDLAENRTAEAETLARAAVTRRRIEAEPERTGSALVTLAIALVRLGRTQEAVDAVDEAERLAKPDPANPLAPVSPVDVALVRGLAAPAHAEAQLAILRAAQHAPGCAECQIDALLDEAEIERAAGHRDRARGLLVQVQRRGHAIHAEDLAARAALLLADHP
ncbi:MAG TPA: hypothetical protein VFQ65_19915, partial [Kofleriaceae bacterium]|nr:hypothetical protein [Kofleriaceae bacterium]